MGEILSKKALGEFLRSRRERLSPQAAGIIAYGSRRTAGLRREEVALLAHIGTSWYTSLEQGRSINPSEDVLNNLAQALQLTESERAHLHLLARPNRQEQVEPPSLHTGLDAMIQALDPNPAYVLGRYWDLLCWNKAAEFIFHFPPYAPDMPTKPNYMRLFLDNHKQWTGVPDGEAKSLIMIARFRADYGHYPHDPGFQTLIAEFMESSPLFRESWPRHDVQVVAECHKQWNDPHIGELEFEHLTLQPSIQPDVKVMVYTATTDTAERLRKVISVVKQ